MKYVGGISPNPYTLSQQLSDRAFTQIPASLGWPTNPISRTKKKKKKRLKRRRKPPKTLAPITRYPILQGKPRHLRGSRSSTLYTPARHVQTIVRSQHPPHPPPADDQSSKCPSSLPPPTPSPTPIPLRCNEQTLPGSNRTGRGLAYCLTQSD